MSAPKFTRGDRFRLEVTGTVVMLPAPDDTYGVTLDGKPLTYLVNQSLLEDNATLIAPPYVPQVGDYVFVGDRVGSAHRVAAASVGMACVESDHEEFPRWMANTSLTLAFRPEVSK